MNFQPNNLTAKTLKMSYSGKNVKQFTTKNELYADLRLREIDLAAKERKERRKMN